MNGSGTPMTGNILIATATLSTAWMSSQAVTEAAAMRQKTRVLRFAMRMPTRPRLRNRPITTIVPSRPISSPSTAKT